MSIMKITRNIGACGFIMFTTSFAVADTSSILISQKNRTYAPGEVTIRKGESIKIINDDIFLHHTFIDSDVMKYDSGSQKKGTVVEIAFKEYGQYDVLCAIHPKMKLAVTVE